MLFEKLWYTTNMFGFYGKEQSESISVLLSLLECWILIALLIQVLIQVYCIHTLQVTKIKSNGENVDWTYILHKYITTSTNPSSQCEQHTHVSLIFIELSNLHIHTHCASLAAVNLKCPATMHWIWCHAPWNRSGRFLLTMPIGQSLNHAPFRVHLEKTMQLDVYNMV